MFLYLIGTVDEKLSICDCLEVEHPQFWESESLARFNCNLEQKSQENVLLRYPELILGKESAVRFLVGLEK